MTDLNSVNNTPAPDSEKNAAHKNLTTRARGRRKKPSKIPRNMITPGTGEIVTLSKLQRGIVRRLPIADKFNEIAEEMKCSNATVSRTFKTPAVQAYLRAQMEAAGITHGLLMQRLREGLDATKEDKTGGERVDHGERREHIKLALRLQGLDSAPEEKADPITNTNIYNIVINARKARGLDE